MLFAIASFTSCIKDTNSGTEVSGLQPIALIYGSGIANFSSANLSFPGTDPSDTVFFQCNYASTGLAPKDIVYTLGYNAAALAAYNATSTLKYSKLPDSCYSFKATSVTIKAGQNYSANIPLTIYPSKMDPSQNYMLPISITDASGVTISGNFGTLYIHAIGNPLAGTYNVVGKRYNYTGVISYSGGPIPTGYVSTATCPSPKIASVIDGVTIGLDYANLGGNGYQYTITYDPATQTISNVSGNFLSAVSNFACTTKTYDPVNKIIHITTTYNNGAAGSGNDRVVDEVFTHQ